MTEAPHSREDLITAYFRVNKRAGEHIERELEIDKKDRLAFLQWTDAEQAPDWWAWEQVEELVTYQPEEGWLILVELVNAAEDDDQLGGVAAGHLEEFVIEHGERFMEQITAEASQNAKFRKALSGIWLDPSPLRRQIRPLLQPPYLPAFYEHIWS